MKAKAQGSAIIMDHFRAHIFTKEYTVFIHQEKLYEKESPGYAFQHFHIH